MTDLPRLRHNLDGDVYLEFRDIAGDLASLDVQTIHGVWTRDAKVVLSVGSGFYQTGHDYQRIMELLAPIVDEENE